ncbi:MAG: GAF domain-containing protein [Acidobacteriota bacterium]
MSHDEEPKTLHRAGTRLNSLWATRGLHRDAILEQVVVILHEEIDRFDWVGIYVLDGDELQLHSQRGRPTPHETIPVGRGICGAAMQANDTIVVPDVKQDDRYLACNLQTASEIVVPIRVGNTPVAQIDIDSDRPDAFRASDREFLESIAARLGTLLADSADTLPPTDASLFTDAEPA